MFDSLEAFAFPTHDKIPAHAVPAQVGALRAPLLPMMKTWQEVGSARTSYFVSSGVICKGGPNLKPPVWALCIEQSVSDGDLSSKRESIAVGLH